MALDDYKNIFGKPDKAEVDAVKNIDLRLVARSVGETYVPPEAVTPDGKRHRIRTAVDYMMYVCGLPYGGTVKYLLDTFGKDAKKGVYTVDKILRINAEKCPDSLAALEVKQDLVRRELLALKKPLIRITVTKLAFDDNGEPIIGANGRQKVRGLNLSKFLFKTEQESFFNYLDVIKAIPQLNYFNANGCNIFITPIEYCVPRENIYILIDDVHDIDDMIATYGDPNLILQSSPSSRQVIYVVKNTIDYYGDKKQIQRGRYRYINFFNDINREFGDVNVTGQRHPFRLAGYANNKPWRAAFFVKIIHADPKAENGIAEIISSKPELELEPSRYREVKAQML